MTVKSITRKTGRTHIIQPACTIASVRKHSLRCDLLSPSVPQTLTKREYEQWLKENYGSE